MFSVGQRVWHSGGQRSGTVLECDGDRVFIEQDNGAEVDFRMSDVTATPPAAAAPHFGGDAGGQPDHARQRRALTANDITPEHARVLGLVPARTLQAVAALFERRPGAGKFSAQDVAAKLNFITEMTSVPYLTMRDYSDRPGELGLLMGKALADNSKR
jgi:hypothetical protein